MKVHALDLTVYKRSGPRQREVPLCREYPMKQLVTRDPKQVTCGHCLDRMRREGK